ncbi:glycosyltransferase family 4 protein [Pseudidiomarina mangrovi]|uniref:glycosyltransferase family 4 protein n=1 Tax=Pseudidiomarina mangrovi TaxID=2487133 RepID=UPI000FCBEEF6|nr:glycosyltransferase [Pseudidiomarina mangrovi]
MRILTFTGHYLPSYKGGGPIKTIKNLFDTTGSGDIAYRLITADRDLGDAEPFRSVKIGAWNRVGNADVYYVSAGSVGREQIKGIITKEYYDFIYVNSFFSFRFSIYPQFLARNTKRIIIVGPRGEFSEGALKLKSFKKKLFIAIYRAFGFHRRAIFQASSDYEARDIKRELGNSVDIRIAENLGAQEFALDIPQKNSDINRIIVVSRISLMKNLLQAIQILKHVSSPVVYDIYGPIEDKEYWTKCEAEIKQLPAHVEVRYQGVLTPDQVVNTMATYDMFFMPTLGENYGHVIAEAFCAGLPVLIADTTPWRQLEEKGIGWDIPLSKPDKFARAIDEFAALTDKEYQAKRQKVLRWAKHKFSQRDAIEANIAMFKYAYEKSRKQ